MGPDAMILVFWMLSFKPTVSLSSFTFIKRLFSSHCLFNLYAEYNMRNAWLDEAQAGIKIAGRNISNLRYEDDTILMAESEEELKSILMKEWKINFNKHVKSKKKKNMFRRNFWQYV